MTAPQIGLPRLSVRWEVRDELHIAIIRLHAAALGRTHGLDPDAIDRLGTVVTALATNIARHARTGHLVLRAVGEQLHGCIEVLALDRGPGIRDMTRALRQGTPGPEGVPREAGLPGVRRIADFFDIYSSAGRGTAIVVHVGNRSGEARSACAASVTHRTVGVVCLALRGEDECGDDWAVEVVEDRPVAMLVDGLGHGPGAALAASAAMSLFRDVATRSPETMLGAMHTALRNTRGAALSIATIQHARGAVRFCGIGNVDGRVLTAESSRQLMPQSGIVGHTMPRIHGSEVPWAVGGRLVMHSDGISSRWNAADYPGLLVRHPALLAGVIFRDFARERDDATVLVLRDDTPAAPEE